MDFWSKETNKSFVQVLLALDSEQEAQAFLRDLMTEAEVAEFARRWKAARLLAQGVPYTSIEAETGLSSATIARVSKWLHKGQGGYRVLLKKLGIAEVTPKGEIELPVSKSNLQVEKSVEQESANIVSHAKDAHHAGKAS
ncbi:MAG: hypothetical protein KDD62_07590 [Bdellovibrionales bacterium]|nr:hypothetical protein [Bdellovibrionales bacterium]